MRYSSTFAAFAAFAATVLAVPVLDRRADTVVTVTTTIIQTVTDFDFFPDFSDTFDDGFFGPRRSRTVISTVTYIPPATTTPTVNPTIAPTNAPTTPTTPIPTTPSTIVVIISSSTTPVTTPTTTPTIIPTTPITSNPTIIPTTMVTTIITTTPVTTNTPTVTPTTAPTTAPTTVTPSATTSEAPVASPVGDAFDTEVLTVHNTLRAQNSAPALTYNSTLAAFALSVVSTCMFQHSGGPYGENLAAGYATPTDAINAWYAEGANYNFANPGFSEATGHFTQVVWVAATQLGCAIATCDGTNGTPGNFLACEYDTGNVIGQFAQNVLPPT